MNEISKLFSEAGSKALKLCFSGIGITWGKEMEASTGDRKTSGRMGSSKTQDFHPGGCLCIP